MKLSDIKKRLAELKEREPRCLVGLHEYDEPSEGQKFVLNEAIEMTCKHCKKKKRFKFKMSPLFFDRFPFM